LSGLSETTTLCVATAAIAVESGKFYYEYV